MIKFFFPLVLILILISCKQRPKSTDVFEQNYPDSIPTIFAPDIISIKGRLEHGISFTPDNEELVFGVLNKEDFSGKIFHSKMGDKNWTKPIVFDPLKDESVFLPYFSPDGKSILFAKSSSETDNYLTNIWVITKKNNLWDNPKKIEAPISSIARESMACITSDGTIYFSSNRNGNGLADLYFSKLDNGEYLNAERIDSVSTERDEESVFISPDENYMVFSRYVADDNPPDLFISYRESNGNWTKPRLLDTTINTADWERRPFVSVDNKFLFFTRLETEGFNLIESDIYWVNTSKVFKPFVYNPLSDITLQVGEQLEVQIPVDYFKDIDDEELTLSINQNELDWLEFESERMKLSGLPTQEGNFELIFTAEDEFSNMTEDRIKIKVKN
ncbi:MAG: PD40 domain-containing protein [Flavobacteriaceae bacterium]|nr:PD40 domain-containing protein [Flavobacteriaceae bacterium]